MTVFGSHHPPQRPGTPEGAADRPDTLHDALDARYARHEAAGLAMERASYEASPASHFAVTNVRRRPGGGPTRGIAMQGELDVATTAIVDMIRLVPDDDGSPYVVDLHALTFIDAAGVTALGRHVEKVVGAVVVTPPSAPGVQRVLDLAVTYEWLPEAFASVRPASVGPASGVAPG